MTVTGHVTDAIWNVVANQIRIRYFVRNVPELDFATAVKNIVKLTGGNTTNTFQREQVDTILTCDDEIQVPWNASNQPTPTTYELDISQGPTHIVETEADRPIRTLTFDATIIRAQYTVATKSMQIRFRLLKLTESMPLDVEVNVVGLTNSFKQSGFASTVGDGYHELNIDLSSLPAASSVTDYDFVLRNSDNGSERVEYCTSLFPLSIIQPVTTPASITTVPSSTTTTSSSTTTSTVTTKAKKSSTMTIVLVVVGVVVLAVTILIIVLASRSSSKKKRLQRTRVNQSIRQEFTTLTKENQEAQVELARLRGGSAGAKNSIPSSSSSSPYDSTHPWVHVLVSGRNAVDYATEYNEQAQNASKQHKIVMTKIANTASDYNESKKSLQDLFSDVIVAHKRSSVDIDRVKQTYNNALEQCVTAKTCVASKTPTFGAAFAMGPELKLQ
jgi:hypothetical protein